MHLFAVLNHRDFIIVGSRVSGFVRNGHRDILAEIVWVGGTKAGQRIHELADAAGGHDMSAQVGRGGKIVHHCVRHQLLTNAHRQD
ncbi:MAG: hypothetical protein WAZ60_17875 [Desulfosalsimonadaceae bacterium]